MNRIIISKKLRVFIVICIGITLPLRAFEQDKEIRGKVFDNADGLPLSHVSIKVKGTDAGAQTDDNGNFSLKTSLSANILTISSAEYVSQDIDISNGGYIEVRLIAKFSTLNNVVLIGYGSARKKDLTGAVSSVWEDDFNKGIYSSPDQLLIGKVAGLQITNNNGQPGGATTIKIRGNSALSGSGQPLFVIDGAPLDGRTLQAGVNPLNFLNPDDIEMINVLKDASATAIYGSRAAYGVVIITTKKGKSGQPKITAGVSTGVNSIVKKLQILNPDQFREALKYYKQDSLFDKGGNTDAQNAILQNGIQRNYNIAITGGNENSKYRLSGNVLNNEGILRYSNLKKYGLTISNNFRFLESKKLGLDFNFYANQFIQSGSILENGSGGIIYSALKWNPTDSIKNADGTYRRITEGNPLALLDLIRSSLKVTTVSGTLSPYLKITKWLEYRLLFNVNYSTGISRSSVSQLISPPGQPRGSATVSNNELSTRQITHTLNFEKEIRDGFRLSATAGFEYTKFVRKGFSASGNGSDSSGFGNFGLDYTNYIQYSSLVGRSIASFADPTSDMQSFFGRTIFNLREKYLLTATVRADGSSKFGNNNRYGYFPSFASAWVISKEPFFKIDFISLLKLRAGWGKTGNQEFPAGSAQARYSFFDGGVLRQVNNPNPDLKWQSDRQYNLGIDLLLLNSNLSLTVDYFNKLTTNLLFPSPPIQPVPPDAPLLWKNLPGKISNKGLELQVNASVLNNKEYGLSLALNATFLKNNVTGLPATVFTGFVSGPIEVIQNGYAMNTFYTRKFLGFDKDGFSNYADSGVTFYHSGSPNPKVLLGINPAFRFKKFSLTTNLYGAFGQKVFFTPLMAAMNVGGISFGNNIGLSVYKNPEKESLQNPSQSPSTRFIFKGDYIRMANLTLNYKIGDIKKIIKEANVNITVQNLFTITKYPGFDPEINSDKSINGIPSLGIDYLEYPASRTFMIGLNFSL